VIVSLALFLRFCFISQSNRSLALADAEHVEAAIFLMMQKMPCELFLLNRWDCKSVESLPSGEDWQYEIKFDGYGAIAIKQRGDV